ncbi:response regulator [Polymorphobacter fuscus]|uniref:Response regulator n=1 Tax=Sandarakinorhabdus fusca TaxID=1439888 RepID=A0A7C9KW48_9SPHN|nr:response regulator [Polymorphobacter fuscus]KAB7648802.1 response regulator [Polymorphobacter fuscus]MQT16382.1 response regulator [Polymorphobacter fuscus]NJC07329.1 CheY-like chemotaxis protein [Polymorphobacter fuscus]
MIAAIPPRLRVLVIEDEPLVAMNIEFSIEALGHDMVGPIARLDEAMAAASGDDYDCAVIDINIVGGSSHEVAAIFAARARPFILASGYNDLSLPEALRNHSRLVKPYTSDQLERQLLLMFTHCGATAPAD